MSLSTMPKIPLDSSSDLAFLRTQIQQALSQRLQTHLPNALPEDAFRNQIEKHISEFLSKTMQETVQNITINGLAPRPSDIAKGIQVEAESYETFDTVLSAAVLQKHAELEATITRVTKMRREVPDAIKAAHAPLVLPDLEELKRMEEEEEATQKGGQEETVNQNLVIEIPRLDEVKQTYEQSMRLMKEMKSNVGSVSAKVQRARDVLEYIQSEQPASTQM